MNRMWEIRESNHPHYGMRDFDMHSEYDEGFEDGYKKAMEEISYSERRGMRRY